MKSVVKLALAILIVSLARHATAAGEDRILRWDQSTAAAEWTGRSGHASVAFNGRLWVLGGGGSGSSYYNDVWSSSDGVSWRQETPSAPWSARYGHSCVVHNNRMWVIGGRETNDRYNDVWSSENGVNWQQETANAEWWDRAGHASLSFDGKIWVIGGGGDYGTDEVWSSTDGVHWQQSPRTFPWWGPRGSHTCVTHNGKMWVAGGVYRYLIHMPPPPYEYRTVHYNDVWSSVDGTHWEEATTSAPWQSRADLESVEQDGRIWIVGGGKWPSDTPPSFYSDAWSSAEGTTWTLETAGPWEPRGGHTCVFLGDRIYLMGGSGCNDVWNYGWHDPLPPLKARAEWNLLSSENPRVPRVLPFAPSPASGRRGVFVSAATGGRFPPPRR